MEFIGYVVIGFFIYFIIFSVYKFIKENSLRKRLETYNREEVLYQDSTGNYGIEYAFSYHTILTNKKLYLYKFAIFPPIYWEIKNKLIKNITYKPLKIIFFNATIYKVKINNHKKHLISNKNELDVFVKRLKTVNPSIKISEIK